MVIASGTSSRHASALAEKLLKTLRQTNDFVPTAEGIDRGDWILVDAGDVVVHVFREEIRELYNLEKMWTIPAPEQLAVISS